MNDHSQTLQRAITQARAKGPLQLWVLMACPNGRCAAEEVN
jgi:hypothetical protein